MWEQIEERHVRWLCDNWAAFKIMDFISMKVDCLRIAIKINGLIQEFQVNFEIVWQTRESEEIRFADKVSKDFDFGGYRISDRDFHKLINGCSRSYPAISQRRVQGVMPLGRTGARDLAISTLRLAWCQGAGKGQGGPGAGRLTGA